jgi:hypothetical protein
VDLPSPSPTPPPASSLPVPSPPWVGRCWFRPPVQQETNEPHLLSKAMQQHNGVTGFELRMDRKANRTQFRPEHLRVGASSLATPRPFPLQNGVKKQATWYRDWRRTENRATAAAIRRGQEPPGTPQHFRGCSGAHPKKAHTHKKQRACAAQQE